MSSKKYDGMNAYEIVDLIVNKEMRCSVSENDINYFIPDGQVVLALLKQKYGAHYVEPEDLHFCGEYCFENPNWVEKPCLDIYVHEFSDTRPEFKHDVTINSFEDGITRIAWLECHGKNDVDKMAEKVRKGLEKNHNHYVGNSCIYMIKEGTRKTAP